MIIYRIGKTAFYFMFSSPQKVKAFFFAETIICPVAVINSDFAAYDTTIFAATYAFTDVFTTLTNFSFSPVFYYTIMLSKS